jgi:hypothetical protein
MTRRWTVEGGELESAALRDSRIGWKGEPERENGMWLTLAPDGRVRRLVRSKVWENGVSGWVGSCDVEELERSGSTVLTCQLSADIKGKHQYRDGHVLVL